MTSNDELAEHRKRVMLNFQVLRGTCAWAPWGASGWSAVEVQTAQRKWAHVHRIKPGSGKRSGTTVGKVRIDRLLRRDPNLMGKDRPAMTPDEIFEKIEVRAGPSEPSAPTKLASAGDMGTRYETSKQQQQARSNPWALKPDSELTQAELDAKHKRMRELFDSFGDDMSDDDDW